MTCRHDQRRQRRTAPWSKSSTDNGYNYTYVEANEGHSWGNWRGQLGNMLVSLIGSPPHATGDYTRDGIVDAADYALLA